MHITGQLRIAQKDLCKALGAALQAQTASHMYWTVTNIGSDDQDPDPNPDEFIADFDLLIDEDPDAEESQEPSESG